MLSKHLVNLLKVKTIITFVIVGVFAVLAIRGDISADNVLVMTMNVVAFYFGTQHEKATNGINSAGRNSTLGDGDG